MKGLDKVWETISWETQCDASFNEARCLFLFFSPGSKAERTLIESEMRKIWDRDSEKKEHERGRAKTGLPSAKSCDGRSSELCNGSSARTWRLHTDTADVYAHVPLLIQVDGEAEVSFYSEFLKDLEVDFIWVYLFDKDGIFETSVIGTWCKYSSK